MIDIYNPDSPVGDPENWALLDGGKYQLPSLGYVSGFSNIYGSIGSYPAYPYNVPGYPVGVPVKMAMVRDPAQKIFLIHEYYLYSHTTASNYYQRSQDSYASAPDSRNVQRRMWPHNDGAPQIFADGHVKWLSRKSASKWACGDTFAGDRLRQCWHFEPHLPVPGT
jgi:prepilin-type processing-associated H-X9-DG protein